MAVVLISDQRIVGRGALRDLGDIPDIVVGILLPLKDRAAGADAHVAVLHLRRGLRNAACRAQILEGVGGRKERRAGSVFRCYLVQPFQSVIGIVQRVAGGGGHFGQAAVAACACSGYRFVCYRDAGCRGGQGVSAPAGCGLPLRGRHLLRYPKPLFSNGSTISQTVLLSKYS